MDSEPYRRWTWLQSSNATGATQTTKDTIGGGLEVYGLNDGDWLRYDNFNTLNIDSITFRAYRYGLLLAIAQR